MKIKINPDKKAEEWHVGDVISDGQCSHIAMIIQNANCNYVAMDIGNPLDAFSLEESSTLALSTLVTILRRFIAISKALMAILLISFSLYVSVSTAVSTPSISSVCLSPK